MSDSINRTGPTNQIDRLIHEPTRYSIMALLYVVEEADFRFVKNHLDLTPGNLSAHISKLESAGYVTVAKGFAGKYPRTVLSLTAAGREKFEQYRNEMRKALDNLPSGNLRDG